MSKSNDEILEEIIDNAGEKALEEFADKVSSLVRLTAKEIEEIIPEGVDQRKFAELMKVVDDAKKSNKQKADQIRDIAGGVEILVNLLKKIM